jgi:serine/threonine protein kinase
MDYIYDETSDVLGRGGGAIVYRARSMDGSEYVALKRPLPFDLCDERLEREIDVLAKMSHDHVMPVLDHGVDDEGHSWYAMPVARGSLKKLWLSGQLGDDVDAVCAEVLEHVCLGLGAMHDAGYLHRDVNPNNILALDDPREPRAYRWVIADCGLVRRPLGETTHGLTGSVSRLGTDGYIAPEGFGQPHAVTEAADVYSLGRVLGWLTTGEEPVLTQPLLPDGTWRPVIRNFTFDAPLRRPQTMSEALTRAQELRADLPTSEKAKFRTDLREKGSGLKTDNSLWDVVLENLDDHAFMIDDVVDISDSSVRRFAAARPEDAARLGERMALHLVQGDWGHRNFDSANENLDWVHSVLEGLVDAKRYDLLEDVGAVYCEAVSNWNRFRHNDVLTRWLTELRGRAGDAIARAIHQSGETDYFRRITERQTFASAALVGLFEN